MSHSVSFQYNVICSDGGQLIIVHNGLSGRLSEFTLFTMKTSGELGNWMRSISCNGDDLMGVRDISSGLDLEGVSVSEGDDNSDLLRKILATERNLMELLNTGTEIHTQSVGVRDEHFYMDALGAIVREESLRCSGSREAREVI